MIPFRCFWPIVSFSSPPKTRKPSGTIHRVVTYVPCSKKLRSLLWSFLKTIGYYFHKNWNLFYRIGLNFIRKWFLWKTQNNRGYRVLKNREISLFLHFVLLFFHGYFFCKIVLFYPLFANVPWPPRLIWADSNLETPPIWLAMNPINCSTEDVENWIQTVKNCEILYEKCVKILCTKVWA